MDEEGSHVAVHFAQNLSRIKPLLKEWSELQKEVEDQYPIQIEVEIAKFQNSKGGVLHTQDDKENLISLESTRNKILKEREEVWRLKRRAIWMECGDDNTKFF